MTLFYFKFIVTNILFSVIIGAVLVRHNRGPRESGAPWIWETMLYALGLGPAFTVLLLYFLMLLLPRQGNMFYLMAVILGFAVLAILGRTGFAILATHGAAFFTDIKKTWQTTRTAQKIKKRGIYPGGFNFIGGLLDWF